MAVQPPTNGVVIPAELGYSVDSLEYVVTVGLGTPPVAQTVVIDSGSDFAWVQCMPCDSGKKDPPFDPRRSSTYAPIPCDSDACRNISDYMGNGCKVDDDPCGFALSYADGSNSTGVYSRDKLTLAPGVAVEGFRFGCSHDQERWTDMSDGLVGLGSSPESLVSQASPSHGGAFSYCLPPTASSTGFLALGRPSNTSGFVFTPMLPSDHVAVFYRVTLTGISVAGRPLDVPPAAFPHGGYGMILDSGTVVTWLPAVPYAAMREAFRRAMAAYPLAPPIHPVDTCYNLTGYSNVTVPSVALAFMGGATVELDNPSGILVEGCLAFAGLRPDDHGNGVIGNVNQRTFELTSGCRVAAHLEEDSSHKVHDPIFNPSKSDTYAAIPCRDKECTATAGKCHSSGTCIYKVKYGDGSSTSGVLSHETLLLMSLRALHGFVFGSGEKNLGLFDVDGFIGLGHGKFSLSS
nr:unnamed protein product [Digitaria exilis]